MPDAMYSLSGQAFQLASVALWRPITGSSEVTRIARSICFFGALIQSGNSVVLEMRAESSFPYHDDASNGSMPSRKSQLGKVVEQVLRPD